MSDATIGPLTAEARAEIDALTEQWRALPQVEIPVHHVLHGGMYARTVTVPAGVAIIGVHVVVPTILVMDGKGTLVAGGEAREIDGHVVLAGSAYRKSIYIAREETVVTMMAATEAASIAEAQAQFTDEAHVLPPIDGDGCTALVTGERRCLESQQQ